MKTKLVLLIMLGLFNPARANLVDITPGGFNESDPPPAFYQWLAMFGSGMLPLADAYISGNTVTWHLDYLPNATQFLSVQPTVDVSTWLSSWHLTDSGWSMVSFLTQDSNGNENIYLVRGGTAFRLDGQGLVTVDGITPLTDISFYGIMGVPDTGSAVALFGIGLLGLLLFKPRKTAKQ